MKVQVRQYLPEYIDEDVEPKVAEVSSLREFLALPWIDRWGRAEGMTVHSIGKSLDSGSSHFTDSPNRGMFWIKTSTQQHPIQTLNLLAFVSDISLLDRVEWVQWFLCVNPVDYSYTRIELLPKMS